MKRLIAILRDPDVKLMPLASSIEKGEQGIEECPVINEGAMTCFCKGPVVEKEVKGDTPNKGRKYMVCSRPWEQKCHFFLFVSPPIKQKTKIPPTDMCKCGSPKLRKILQSGKN